MAKRLNAIKECIQTPHYLTCTLEPTARSNDGWCSFRDWSQSQNYIVRPPFRAHKVVEILLGPKGKIGVFILWLNRGKSLLHQSVPFLIAIQLSHNSENVVAPRVLSKLHTTSWKLEVFNALTLVIETQILLQKKLSIKQWQAVLQSYYKAKDLGLRLTQIQYTNFIFCWPCIST